MYEFEWDEAKAANNLVKHKVSFAFATHLFVDDARVDADASRVRDDEQRWKVIGTIDGKLYTAVVTLRGTRYRLISARRANAAEARAYGHG